MFVQIETYCLYNICIGRTDNEALPPCMLIYFSLAFILTKTISVYYWSMNVICAVLIFYSRHGQHLVLLLNATRSVIKVYIRLNVKHHVCCHITKRRLP